MLISSTSELRSVSTVYGWDSRFSSLLRKAPGLVRNFRGSESEMAADCLRELDGELREIDFWDAVSASESASSGWEAGLSDRTGDMGGSCRVASIATLSKKKMTSWMLSAVVNNK
jgi:hypothetical protein